MKKCVHYQMQNDMSALAELSEYLECHPEFQELGDGARYKLQLTLEEMVSNIIKYGYDDEERHQIELDIVLSADGVFVRVSDDGHPFNPLEDAAPAMLADELELQQIGGMGLLLVREMTDELLYRREEGWNILEFRLS